MNTKVVGDILLLVIIFGCLGYWIRAVVTYDWSKFDEDSANDDFLKPYDDHNKK